MQSDENSCSNTTKSKGEGIEGKKGLKIKGC